MFLPLCPRLPWRWYSLYSAFAVKKGKTISYVAANIADSGCPADCPVSESSLRGFITNLNPKLLPQPLLTVDLQPPGPAPAIPVQGGWEACSSCRGPPR